VRGGRAVAVGGEDDHADDERSAPGDGCHAQCDGPAPARWAAHRLQYPRRSRRSEPDLPCSSLGSSSRLRRRSISSPPITMRICAPPPPPLPPPTSPPHTPSP